MKGQPCHGCGKPRAGGGQRFCTDCLGVILSNRAPAAPTAPASGYRYPLPRPARKPKKAGKQPAQPDLPDAD